MENSNKRLLRVGDRVNATGWGTIMAGNVVDIRRRLRGIRVTVFNGSSIGSYRRKNVKFLSRASTSLELKVRKFIETVTPELGLGVDGEEK